MTMRADALEEPAALAKSDGEEHVTRAVQSLLRTLEDLEEPVERIAFVIDQQRIAAALPNSRKQSLADRVIIRVRPEDNIRLKGFDLVEQIEMRLLRIASGRIIPGKKAEDAELADSPVGCHVCKGCAATNLLVFTAKFGFVRQVKNTGWA